MFAITLNFIICVQGLFAFRSLRNNYDESYRVCLKSLTDIWFDNNNFVYVLSDTNDDDISFDIPRSKIIVKPNSTGQISIKPNIISNNFVMVRGVGCMTLGSQLEYFKRIGILSLPLAPKYKFFIVNHEKPNWQFYKTLWSYNVFSAIVLLLSRDKPYEEIKLYWSNPFTVGNGCGNRSNEIKEYKCTDSVEVAALKAFGANKDCPLPFTNMPFKNHRRYILTILDLLRKKFNMQVTVGKVNKDKAKIQTYLSTSASYWYEHGKSQEYFIQQWIWILPVPRQLSLIEIYFIIFQKEVWLMVAIGFGIALLLYVALVALYRLPLNINRIVFIKLEILSLTVWGSYSRNPKIRAVCVFLLCYSFYATVIQTAYVSGLMRVLTIPQYEKGIKTLEELADSSIPVHAHVVYMDVFKRYKDSHEIIRKILPKVIWINNTHLKQTPVTLSKYNNISILTNEDIVFHFLNEKMNQSNLIFDTSLFGHYAHVLVTYPAPNYHFMNMLDKCMTALKENGIFNKFELNEMQNRRSYLPQNSHPTDPQVLTMGHLYGIFVIYGIGVCISCIVFVVEIMTHYYRNRKHFTSVQVLNGRV